MVSYLSRAPAGIREDSGLLVDCVCSNMINRMRDNLGIFTKFTTIQLETILEWLLDLGEKTAISTHMTIKNALAGYHYW